jgi:hypothetical protein
MLTFLRILKSMQHTPAKDNLCFPLTLLLLSNYLNGRAVWIYCFSTVDI